jgi:hypothetical protein
VSFAGSAPVPQQVQIGAGWGDLGAAFSAFSQTLAGVFTQVTKIDRQKAMEEGEQKMLANRTNYRKMVESGQIDPVENPWEALGAASADATMHADRWKTKVRAEYQQRIMSDPGFATSVGAAEDFINQRMKTELDSGLDNPVWQRTFMKDTSAFVTNMSITHADEVVKNRRLRAEEGLVTGILSDYKDWSAVKGDTQIPLHEQFNARKDEYYQTYGAQLTQSALTKVFIKLREDSGDDPAVLEELSKVTLGTGPFTSTAAYKAAEVASAADLTKARQTRDAKELSSWLSTSLMSGEDVSPQAMKAKLKAIRPGMPDDELAQITTAVSKNIEPMRTQLYDGFRSGLVSATSKQMLKAYMPDANGNIPMDFASIKARDQKQTELSLMGQLNATRARLGMPLSKDASEEQAKILHTLAVVSASEDVRKVSMGLKDQNGNPDYAARAGMNTTWAVQAGTQNPDMSEIETAVQLFRQSPSPEAAKSFIPAMTLGWHTYRAAKARGASPKSIGMTEETEAFFESMNSTLNANGSIEAGMMNASAQVPRGVPIPTMMTPDDIATSAVAHFNRGFTGRGTAVRLADDVQPYLIAEMSRSENRMRGADARKAAVENFLTKHALVLDNGTVVMKPEFVNAATQSFTSPGPWNTLSSAYKKVLSAKDPTIQGVKFKSLANGKYYVQVYRADQSSSELSSDAIAELNANGLTASFSIDEVNDVYIKSKVKEQDAVDEILKNMQTNTQAFRFGGPF